MICGMMVSSSTFLVQRLRIVGRDVPDIDVVDVVLDGIGAHGDPVEAADDDGGKREQSVHCQLSVAHYPPSLEY